MVINMFNMEEYENLYDDMIKKLTPSDTQHLMLEAKTEEQKNFYRIVGNYLLQKEQKSIIKRGLF